MSARFPASGYAVAAACTAALLMLACGAARPEPAPSVTSSTAASGSAAEASAAGQPSPAVQELWRTRCNQCHVRVEPRTRERATLTRALERHRKRARLSESDVQELVEYLAK